MAQVDLKNATIKIKDGDDNEVEVKIGEGNFQWTERVNREYMLDRGVLDEVRNGDEAPVEVSFDFKWEYIKGPGIGSSMDNVTIEDALKRRGGAAAWVSSDADACRPYAVDLELKYEPDCATGDIEILTFSDFRYEQLDHDASNGSIACSGRCNIVQPTSNRYAGS